MQRITPCLWFDGQAEEAAELYTSIFPNSRVTSVSRFSEAGQEQHGQKPGSVMVVEFELDGEKLTGLNGGPLFTFSEAISFQVGCDTQQEIDHYWNALTDGGAESQCGWLKDRYGVSWQIVPRALGTMMTDPDPKKRERVMGAVMSMQKLDLAALQRAYDGE
jgi:predicted 3-demethylubiquinone-9 3-methyltransferase (glyoxalase superfamily)